MRRPWSDVGAFRECWPTGWPLLAKMEAEGKITIVGGLHDLNTEAVTFLP
jgi:hypothetical protein